MPGENTGPPRHDSNRYGTVAPIGNGWLSKPVLGILGKDRDRGGDARASQPERAGFRVVISARSFGNRYGRRVRGSSPVGGHRPRPRFDRQPGRRARFELTRRLPARFRGDSLSVRSSEAVAAQRVLRPCCSHVAVPSASCPEVCASSSTFSVEISRLAKTEGRGVATSASRDSFNLGWPIQPSRVAIRVCFSTPWHTPVDCCLCAACDFAVVIDALGRRFRGQRSQLCCIPTQDIKSNHGIRVGPVTLESGLGNSGFQPGIQGRFQPGIQGRFSKSASHVSVLSTATRGTFSGLF
jgi:hypothetical protein